MNYQETLDYLYTRLPMYQRDGKSAYKKDLTNTHRLLAALGHPERKFKSVHIAGTNGKGTSAHALAAILQTSGYRTGLYTSPHLKAFTERIKLDGEEVPPSFVVEFVNDIKGEIEMIAPSFFEITVAMAFSFFAHEKVDIAVIETGLGGRLDSTNVIMPEVSLITNIGWDHMDMLGDTLPKIASEKAGIIKPGTPVVIGEATAETKPVFTAKAKQENAPITFAQPREWTFGSLTPDYLKLNLPGILATCSILSERGFPISEKARVEGIANLNQLTGLKGRFQVIQNQPLTIADVSHNLDGLKVLFKQIERIKEGNLHLIYGTVKDKDLNPIFQLFSKETILYWSQSHVPRSLEVSELAIQGVVNGLEGNCFKDVNEALEEAKSKAKPEDLILITGSTFLVAEISDL